MTIKKAVMMRKRSTQIPTPICSCKKQIPNLPKDLIPRHIAIIMDGNGRWAGQRNLSRSEGHRAGEAALLEVVYAAIEMGVEYLSVYAFSTENWRRSTKEVEFLMRFNSEVIHRQQDDLMKNGVRVKWIGNRSNVRPSTADEMSELVNVTKDNDRLTLGLCFNYGGRDEIVHAAKVLARECTEGKILVEDIDEEVFQKCFFDPEMPDVDLFIRTSGEQRISNFLLWQLSYAEFLFLDKLWPDVDRCSIYDAVEVYARRDRRFGA